MKIVLIKPEAIYKIIIDEHGTTYTVEPRTIKRKRFSLKGLITDSTGYEGIPDGVSITPSSTNFKL